jgi:hypothetical protein
VCGQHHAPAAFTLGKDPVPIVQEAGWAPEPVWIGAENLAPPGFDPRTFQPVASRYTDYAIPAPHTQMYKIHIIKCKLHEFLFGTTSTSGTTSACKRCSVTAMRYRHNTHEAVQIKLHPTRTLTLRKYRELKYEII